MSLHSLVEKFPKVRKKIFEASVLQVICRSDVGSDMTSLLYLFSIFFSFLKLSLGRVVVAAALIP